MRFPSLHKLLTELYSSIYPLTVVCEDCEHKQLKILAKRCSNIFLEWHSIHDTVQRTVIAIAGNATLYCFDFERLIRRRSRSTQGNFCGEKFKLVKSLIWHDRSNRDLAIYKTASSASNLVCG